MRMIPAVVMCMVGGLRQWISLMCLFEGIEE